jgi:ribbon-helix-helix protein
MSFNSYVPWYFYTNMSDKEMPSAHPIEVERVQTGVRLEKRMLKVLKAIAEQKDMSLGDLLEGIVLHAFEGKAPFSPQTVKDIEQFRILYGLTLRAQNSHQLRERR